MAVIECEKCFKPYEDDVLCCPHCGTAQIPQLSLAEKRLELIRASRGALPAIYTGLVIGLLLGTGLFVATLINGTANLGSGLSILTGGMSGSAIGLIVYRLRHRETSRRRRLSAESNHESDNPDLGGDPHPGEPRRARR